MTELVFSEEDMRQIRALGICRDRIRSQLDLFSGAPPHVKLRKACTVGDGIHTVEDAAVERLEALHQEAAGLGRCLKFVPASGAASRMFRTLLWFLNSTPPMSLDRIAEEARTGEPRCRELIEFWGKLERFAFYPDLEGGLAKQGKRVEDLRKDGMIREIIGFLLSPRGLGYAGLPKGLLKFHRYDGESRTAFEEHLVEAAEYVRDDRGVCRLHFTVSADHRRRFQDLLEEIRTRYEQRYGVRFQVGYSVQERSTDTLAVDLNNEPFRTDDGRLLFRPAGHGALIENLNRLEGDIVFIKNIDNVVPDALKGPTFLWKKILAGVLLDVQERTFAYLARLERGDAGPKLLSEILEFAGDRFCMDAPARLSNGETAAWLMNRLNRPIRVCGVVRNVSEPGGGPFWVEEEDGTLSLQIVESAQVDQDSAEQMEIWNSATHFNPVDLVCGVRDFQGRPFDLRRFVNPRAVIITRKSEGGRDLKALELPGLWNGGMARWNTLFVEVPLITFNPVKTVMDLLRDTHQRGQRPPEP